MAQPSNRIRATFERLAANDETGLVAYVTAGHPTAGATEHVLDELVSAGVDLIELGVPFSDPMADGPAIQAAMTKALAGGMTFPKVLEIARNFRQRHPDIPLVLFGYTNPMYAYGLEAACNDAAAAGVDGLLVVDMPPEHAPELTRYMRPAGLDFIALFTPTSDDARVQLITAHASGFAYYVSMTGVTGGAIAVDGGLAQRVAKVRQLSGLPVAVGFGVRSVADALAVREIADAVVVGSALLRAMDAVLPIEAPFAAGELMGAIKKALLVPTKR